MLKRCIHRGYSAFLYILLYTVLCSGPVKLFLFRHLCDLGMPVCKRRFDRRFHRRLYRCFDSCFCVDMGANRTTEGYVFSVDIAEGMIRADVPDPEMNAVFAAHGTPEEVTPAYVTENEVHVRIPENVPLSIIKDPLWDEYTTRCINCGRCNYVCPTCTCYTMQDVFYTDNGKVGERRRVGASCMVDGYTNVAGGGQYRRTNGERMRFKVLHKISDFKKRFGYQMCVGCGRCDDVCPEYISFTNIINKVADAAEKEAEA